jgi:hypothetical protein
MRCEVEIKRKAKKRVQKENEKKFLITQQKLILIVARSKNDATMEETATKSAQKIHHFIHILIDEQVEGMIGVVGGRTLV